MLKFIIKFIQGFYYGVNNTSYLIYFYCKKLYVGSFISALPLVFILSFGIRILPIDDISSMNNTYHGNELIITIKLHQNYSLLNKQDVVLIESYSENIDIIKRIIGEPNDIVEIVNGNVFINDEELDESGYKIDYIGQDMEKIYLSDTQYFILGDNRPVSNDSRYFGPIEEREIKAKVICTLLPVPSVVKR